MLLESFTTYSDEYGEINAEVFREAQNVWRYGRLLSLKILGDEQKGQILLMQAAARVSKKVSEENLSITYLRAYLFTTFRRLVSAEAKKEFRHRVLEEKYFECLEELFRHTGISEEEKICQRILIKEIEARMDDWTRRVSRYRELGYEFKDLVSHLGMAENVIRAKYSRNLKNLAKIIREK
jgi:hypothetical protein